MSASHHDNGFQERKRKLSVWVKRIIQPYRDQPQHQHQTQNRHRRHYQPIHHQQSLQPQQQLQVLPSVQHQQVAHGQSHIRSHSSRHPSKSAMSSSKLPASTGKREPPVRSVVWGDSVVQEANTQTLRLDFDQTHDNASTAPLISHYSSSPKSSVFSDVTSLQSTRATMFSSKTFDTNASTAGIPPASILDRARPHTMTAPAQGAPSIFSTTTTHHTSQANSIRHFSQ